MGFFKKKSKKEESPPQQQQQQQIPVPNPLQPPIPAPKKGSNPQQTLLPPPPPQQQQQRLPTPQHSQNRTEQVLPPQQRQASSRDVRLGPAPPPRQEFTVTSSMPPLPELKTPPTDILKREASTKTQLARHSELEDEAQRNAVTRELVKKFVADIWNKGDLEFIPQVCGKGLRFNGSDGMDRVGHDGFARMVTTIREALNDYHCEIHSMVVEGGKAFCRMRFTGRHAGPLLGYPPTGRQVAWMGAAEFTCKDGKIIKVWELGDVKSLEDQLSGT